MKRNFKIWLSMTKNSFSSETSTPASAILFFLGKVIRFGFFLLFLIILLDKTKFLQNYSKDQVILFFLSYNLVDTTSQMLFREVYRARSLIVTGNFDLILVKPQNPLLRILLGGADLMDLAMLVPLLIFLISTISKLNFQISQIILYTFLLINALTIALALHIFVVSLAILTTEIDHTIMIYRDITRMGTFPIDIYKEPLRSLLTFIIPVAVMMTFPTKALMGLLSPQTVIFSFALGFGLLHLSLKTWHQSLRSYSSASS